MFLAHDKNKKLIWAHKDREGFCPSCGAELVARCGMVNEHHWAHKTIDCDSWSEPVGPWHMGWQKEFDLINCEKVIANHRIDVLVNGIGLEVQHSPLPEDKLIERERFYKLHVEKFAWLFDFSGKKIQVLIPPRKFLKHENSVVVEIKRPQLHILENADNLFFEYANAVYEKIDYVVEERYNSFSMPNGDHKNYTSNIAVLNCYAYHKSDFIQTIKNGASGEKTFFRFA